MFVPLGHEVRFFTRRTNADARAVCTCGWFAFGSLHDVQAAASVHDTEWQVADPEPSPEPSKAFWESAQ